MIYMTKMTVILSGRKKALVEALEKEEDYYIFEFTNKGGLIMPIPLETNI